MHNNTTYIATISGGKDSVTMCDLLLKHGHPVDYIVFNDTLDEFKEMYAYLDKVEAYFKRKYNKEITRLKPSKGYDAYMFRVLSKGNNMGVHAGLPSATQGFCEWRRDAKQRPFEKWAKQFDNHKIYIGITTSEPQRANREDEKFIYPLIDTFRMSEEDCQQYLISNDMENPLYRHFNRTGCRKCHYQSDRDFFNIWKHYPSVWDEFKSYESKVNALPNAIGKHWFKNFRSCSDMEKEFIASDTQGSLFDFSNEPLKDCFCKV